MASYAQALELVDDPDLIAAYKDHHKKVWPEVVARLREIGITRAKIFLVGARLFMYFEAPDGFDAPRDYQKYCSDPRCSAWDVLMRQFQRQVPGASPDVWWTPMELVFDLESASDGQSVPPELGDQ